VLLFSTLAAGLKWYKIG